MKELIETLYHPWNIFMIHVPLFICSWIGCAIAATRAKRPAKFTRTLSFGMVGGAIGGFLNPILLIMYLTGLFMGSGHLGDLLLAFPILLTEGAVLSLPLGVLIAAYKRRERPTEVHSPT